MNVNICPFIAGFLWYASNAFSATRPSPRPAPNHASPIANPAPTACKVPSSAFPAIFNATINP